MTYRLYYWPQLPGRGEFARLVLEDAGADYVDVARLPEDEGGGTAAVRDLMGEHGMFAPPFLETDGELFSQTANICALLAERHGLVPDGDAARRRAHQIMLTIMDTVAEVHDLHHPIAASLYFEEQEQAAIAAATQFGASRLEQWLDYYESACTDDGVLGEFSYVDLGLYQLLAGVRYALPRAVNRALEQRPALRALEERVQSRDEIAEYLASDRRLDFNEHGIFRYYEVLDDACATAHAA